MYHSLDGGHRSINFQSLSEGFGSFGPDIEAKQEQPIIHKEYSLNNLISLPVSVSGQQLHWI
jgi:hypothetical protein